MREKNGCLKELTALGHANFARFGRDIVCAAVSALLNAAGSFFSQENVLENQQKSWRGKLFFRVKSEKLSDEQFFRLKSATDFLLCGLKSLEVEFPKNLRILELF